jgi:flagellar biosynthesis/type III secretory pathway chaperone
MYAHESQEPKRLITLLSEQRELYQRLRDLSERQRSLISSDRPEQLLSILRERQTLVAALAKLNEQLAPFRRNWDILYQGLPADLRVSANKLLQDINGLLRVILKTDQEDSALLAARKQSVGQRLREVGGGQTANTAYARQSGAPSLAPGADMTG